MVVQHGMLCEFRDLFPHPTAAIHRSVPRAAEHFYLLCCVSHRKTGVLALTDAARHWVRLKITRNPSQARKQLMARRHSVNFWRRSQNNLRKLSAFFLSPHFGKRLVAGVDCFAVWQGNAVDFFCRDHYFISRSVTPNPSLKRTCLRPAV